MQFIAHADSPLGGITLASDGKMLTDLCFDGQRSFGDLLERSCQESLLPVFEETRRWLDLYFSGKAADFTPPVSMAQTGFRKTVWEAIMTIPYGKTMTYGEISEELSGKRGRRTSARAVGGAAAHNRILLIIPCHRVLGAGGKLTGYAGGIERKCWLLEHEGIQLDDRLRVEQGR